MLYTIQLTRGTAWDAQVLEVHPVSRAIHLAEVERAAQGMLNDARETSPRLRPTNYRILDHLGNCVRSSATTAPSATWHRAGRTCWAG